MKGVKYTFAQGDCCDGFSYRYTYFGIHNHLKSRLCVLKGAINLEEKSFYRLNHSYMLEKKQAMDVIKRAKDLELCTYICR